MELRGNTCNSASICCAVPTPCSEIFLQVFPRKPRTQAVLHGVVNMQLPNQWLWDMVDEFVYQFQSFCQYQAKMKTKTEQEISLLKQFDQAWSVYGVLNFLQALVEKSMIVPVLEQEKEGLEKFTADAGYDYNGGSNVLKVLGYFSMSRRCLHCCDRQPHCYNLSLRVCQSYVEKVASAPNYEEPLINYNQDAYRLQLKLFLHEVKQQQLLSGVRTYVKVYSTISVGKLATYMEVDEPTLRKILMTYKHKAHVVDSNGKLVSSADIDF
ncbi:hypothetical protein POM88_036131 [Heracleum sosnowskyi]|uniref:Uncharacterized protein n=1 Tax=Heracleum sosnowskyi TaxID=360622 RepID=A0AAD8MEN9_9APIA|nr:hypothetical protein POM88_036131 [Heracleum sosnowskyi]